MSRAGILLSAMAMLICLASAAQPLAQTFAANPLALLAAVFALGILGGLYLAAPISLLVSGAALLVLFGVTALLKRKMKLAYSLKTHYFFTPIVTRGDTSLNDYLYFPKKTFGHAFDLNFELKFIRPLGSNK